MRKDVPRKRNLVQRDTGQEQPREINVEEVSRSTVKKYSVVDWRRW